MNITTMMMSEIKKTMPSRIILGEDEKKKIIDHHRLNTKATPAQLQKMLLIEQVRTDYKLTKNISMTAKHFSLNYRTVKKYLSCKDPLDFSKRKRFSYLDPYRAQILAMYADGNSITEIYKKLCKQGVNCKCRTINYFIQKNIKYSNQTLENSGEERFIIRRKQIFNYVFMYKKEPLVQEKISIIIAKYPLIGTLKTFYNALRNIFLNRNYASLKKILKRKMKTAVLNRIIKSLNTDYIAVVNAAKYRLSNGVVEGSVSKIKRIKHSMYGRGSVTLLRNKAIYQSYFFRRV